MNLEDLKKRPQFKDCVTDDDVMTRITHLETEAGKVPGLTEEVKNLRSNLKTFQDKEEAEAAESRKALLDAAEADGRIDATTRPIYENMLKEHPEDAKKALGALTPKRKVLNDLHINPSLESPWDKRMREIRENKNRK